MDPRFPLPRDDIYALQMDIKQIQLVQTNQAERIARVERRQEQDAHLKSVWQQHPFPGVLAGTPQQGPTTVSASDLYDMDEPNHLLSSLHLGPAEEEPSRRGAASRANSVRFDESALRQSDWASQSNRHSGDFGPPRPSSGMMMERSYSHKSDGRHSSAGHSVHSIHSLASGRASSLGLHTDNFVGGSSNDEDSPIEGSDPPPEFFILGPVPSIIRCWLTTRFSHNTILYADLCTGSQRSVIEYSVVKEMGLHTEIERDVDGALKLQVAVYLVEATITDKHRRGLTTGHIPSITVNFEVVGMDQPLTESGEVKNRIRIFIGSDALRAHMTDILLSKNRMSLIGNHRERLSVPFVRPEDDGMFKHIATANIPTERERPKLNANAAVFISGESRPPAASAGREGAGGRQELESTSQRISSLPDDLLSPTEEVLGLNRDVDADTSGSEEEGDRQNKEGENAPLGPDHPGKEASHSNGAAIANAAAQGNADSNRRASAGSGGGIWGSWRQGMGANGSENGSRETGLLSGYQPAARGGRNMKVLKPLKLGGASSRIGTGGTYDPPSAKGSGGELRRKSQAQSQANHAGSDSGSSTGIRWEAKRAASSSVSLTSLSRETRSTTSSQVGATNASSASNNGTGSNSNGTLPRSANPVGGASAFSWMTPAPGKAKSVTTAE